MYMNSCININVNTLVWFVEAKNQFPNFIFKEYGGDWEKREERSKLGEGGQC